MPLGQNLEQRHFITEIIPHENLLVNEFEHSSDIPAHKVPGTLLAVNLVPVTKFFVAAVGAAASAGPKDGTRRGRDGGRSPSGPPGFFIHER
jgi:hypothetical protein